MAPFLDEGNFDVPLLSEKHSGIPFSLLEKARTAKQEIFDTQTKPVNERQRLPVIPQGIQKDKFFAALDELREDLGDQNVEVNDKPLKDGW